MRVVPNRKKINLYQNVPKERINFISRERVTTRYFDHEILFRSAVGQFRVSFLEDSKLAELAAAEYGSRLDHDWGACVMQGHRGHMEDRIITKSYFNNVYSIYIVFDGHGGDTVVKYAEKEFVKFILDEGEKLFKSFEENPEKYCPNKIKGCKYVT